MLTIDKIIRWRKLIAYFQQVQFFFGDTHIIVSVIYTIRSFCITYTILL